MNEITAISITLDAPSGNYHVAVTKSFSPEYGGGEATITAGVAPSLHRALDIARSAITVSRVYREAFERDAAVSAAAKSATAEVERDWEHSAQFMQEFDPSKAGPGLGE